MSPLLLALALAAHAAPTPAEEDLAQALASWVVERCGADRVEVDWLGVRPALLPSHDAIRFSGSPCSPHPAVRMDLLRAGEEVSYRRLWPHLSVSPSASRGDEVTVRVRRGDLVIEAPARLLVDAAVGGPAKVSNLVTNTILVGTLVDADTVELR